MKKYFKFVHALVRSFNNPDIAKHVHRLLDIGVGSVTVVTNAKMDQNSTRHWLAQAGLIHHTSSLTRTQSQVNLVEMWENYHWSAALNVGMKSILLRNSKDVSEPLFGLHCSVEALLDENHLSAMLSPMLQAPGNVSIVGTTFAATSKGNPVALGRSYRHPRNTTMLVDYRAHGHGQMFDSYCDTIGGMEDIDAIFALRAFSPESEAVMVDARVPLLLGKHHDQAAKEIREQSAMDKIISRWRSVFTRGTLEYDRIEQIIAEMQLEDRKED